MPGPDFMQTVAGREYAAVMKKVSRQLPELVKELKRANDLKEQAANPVAEDLQEEGKDTPVLALLKGLSR